MQSKIKILRVTNKGLHFLSNIYENKYSFYQKHTFAGTVIVVFIDNLNLKNNNWL